MADFGLTAAITLAAAAASTGAAVHGAQQQKKASKKTADAAKRAAQEQAKQIKEAASLERTKRKRESDQIRGRLAVVGAASGADPAGSYAALDRQVEIDDELTFDILQRNERNQINRVFSGLGADLTALEGSRRNVLVDAFGAGIQGASTGLSIYNAIPDAPLPNPADVGPIP